MDGVLLLFCYEVLGFGLLCGWGVFLGLFGLFCGIAVHPSLVDGGELGVVISCIGLLCVLCGSGLGLVFYGCCSVS